MFAKTGTALALMIAMAGTAWADTVEVHMLNKGEAGTMVFEPAFVRINPGDTVKFIPTDKGHNAESIKGMIPEGAERFEGKINQEIDVTFDVEGFYGVECKPHYSMGMVMTVAVGEDATAPDDFMSKVRPPNAKKRFQEQLEQLAGN